MGLNNRVNILMIIPNLDFGGAQESFIKVSRLLDKKYSVFIAVFNTTNIADYNITIPLIDLNVPASSSYFLKLYYYLVRIRRLRDIKRKLNINVSLSFLEGADYVNYFSRDAEKVVCSVRGSKRYDFNIRGILGWLRHRILMPIVYQRVDKIVVVNSPIGTELTEDYQVKADKIVTIYNYYDLLFLRKKSEEEMENAWLQFFSIHKIVITSSRLAPEKGIQFLIRAFANLKAKMGDVRLVILGNGSFFNTLYAETEKCRLKPGIIPVADVDVVFAGYQSNPMKYVRRANVFMLPSLIEGFPNSLVEAMAVGTAVIASNCTYGPGEIILKNNVEGVLVSPFMHMDEINEARIEEWSMALFTVINDTAFQKYLGENARQRASDFTEKEIGSKWIDLVESLTAE